MTPFGWLWFAAATFCALWLGVWIGAQPARYRRHRVKALVALFNDFKANCLHRPWSELDAFRARHCFGWWAIFTLADLEVDGFVEQRITPMPDGCRCIEYRLTDHGIRVALGIEHVQEAIEGP